MQFLQDILDTLFSILDDNTDKYGPLVFQSLVRRQLHYIFPHTLYSRMGFLNALHQVIRSRVIFVTSDVFLEEKDKAFIIHLDHFRRAGFSFF